MVFLWGGGHRVGLMLTSTLPCVRGQSSTFSDEDEAFFLSGARPMTPLVLNPVHPPSLWDDFDPACEPGVDAGVEPPPRLPTPEERMRQQAEAVVAAVVPINITGGRRSRRSPEPPRNRQRHRPLSVPGESFDRQASFRRSSSNSDSLSRRYNLTRRKTITGVPSKSPQRTGTPPPSGSSPGCCPRPTLFPLLSRSRGVRPTPPRSVLNRGSARILPPPRGAAADLGGGERQGGGSRHLEEDPSPQGRGDVQPDGFPHLLRSGPCPPPPPDRRLVRLPGSAGAPTISPLPPDVLPPPQLPRRAPEHPGGPAAPPPPLLFLPRQL